MTVKQFLKALMMLLLLLGSACNKEIDSVELPPFAVFPNPFTDSFGVHLEGSLPNKPGIIFRVLNGEDEEIARVEDLTPGSTFHVDMSAREKAIYYAELSVDNQIFLQPIIKNE